MSELLITLSKKQAFMEKAQAKLLIQSQLKTASVEYISDMCGADFVIILLRS